MPGSPFVPHALSITMEKEKLLLVTIIQNTILQPFHLKFELHCSYFCQCAF